MLSNLISAIPRTISGQIRMLGRSAPYETVAQECGGNRRVRAISAATTASLRLDSDDTRRR